MQGESDGRVIDEERNHDSPSLNTQLGYSLVSCLVFHAVESVHVDGTRVHTL